MSHNAFSYVWWPRGEEPKEEEAQDLPQAMSCKLPKPLNIIDIMRVDWLAQCFAFFANNVIGRQPHIAPCRLTPNFAQMGGWAFISGATEPLDRTVWVFQPVPLVQPNFHLSRKPHKAVVRQSKQELPSTKQLQADRCRR